MFRCRSFGEPWSEVVEEMVCGQLAAELESGDVSAMGLWAGDVLAGVAAWRVDRTVRMCRAILVAVATGHRRRGYGRILKGAVVDAARSAGAVAVVSSVHWDNDAMIELNVALGGNVEVIPGDRDFCRCVIPISPS